MRLSEIYPSIQGEGLHVGEPTLFVRFAGCNLRCPGWPCDTPHAIDPEKYRHEWENVEPEELIRRIEAFGIQRICLTGGEPFLQPKSELEEVVEDLWKKGYRFDCFSNGTILYPTWAPAWITFCMDWKLPSSGEDPFNDNRVDNLNLLHESGSDQAVKFVVKDEMELGLAYTLWEKYIEDKGNIHTYCGVVWGKFTEAGLAEQLISRHYPWKMNVQMHNYIWPPNERGR